VVTVIKETEFFHLYAISDGVYAAIAIPGKGAWSNAGIVDLGEELVVFDSFTTPSAGHELRRQAESLTGKKVKYLINSHYHGDHIFGNQAFSDTSIISTSLTREWCKEKNKLNDVDQEIEAMKDYLNTLQNQIELTRDRVIKTSLTNQHNEMSKVLDDLPDMQIVLPSVTFEGKLTIEGSRRKVELYCMGGAHTPSDTFMYVPDDKVAFMGDIVTEELHVPIYNPADFSNILMKVKEMEIEVFVPGHGNVGNGELLNKVAGYVTFLTNKSKAAVKKKVSLETFISTFETPSEYINWRGTNGIKDNLSKVYCFFAEE
jgi:cyclase